jgi:crotonobetainyl-CoA:carnitine CoA-transferase CaiB-like acyl-CoA transferase
VPQSAADLPLDGLHVLEMGEWIAVPLAGKLLADLGADVTKVERVGVGDATRRWGPFPPGQAADLNASGMFAHLNSSKSGVTVGPDATATQIVTAFGPQNADVIVVGEHFLPGDRAAEVARLRTAAPHAVLVAVTPFGIDGPAGAYVGYDITAAASGGISFGIGEPTRAPLPLPYGQSDEQAGICAAIAALMGVLAASRDGHGDYVDLSIQEVLAALHCGYFLPRYLFGGGIVGLRSGRVGGAQPYPNTVLRCRDGLVAIVAPKIDQWRRFLALMDDPEWATQPRYRNRRAMQWEYKAEVDALIEPWFEQRTKAELTELFVTHRIPFAPIMTGHDLAGSGHLREREAIRETPLPGGTPALLPTVPYRFSRSGWRSNRAPRLGEHGYLTAADGPPSAGPPSAGPLRVAAPGTGAQGTGPLAGLRVLDLGTAWAGGIAGRILGDCGADVIKIESWEHMDGSRMGRPILIDDDSGGDAGKWPDLQPGFHVHGRSKRSVALNLRSEHGRQLLLDLAGYADVLVHNFPRRVLASMGLTAGLLCERNDQLVVVGQSVAGAAGPLADYTGYASTVSALGGLSQGIGYEGEEPIASFEGIYTDVVSAITTVFAVVAGLVERDRSGCGQVIDVSQWEATLALAAEPLVEYSLTGRTRGSEGFSHPLLCPHGNYGAATAPGDDTPGGSWLSIAVESNRQWRALLDHIDPDAELGDDAASWSLDQRLGQRVAIDRRIERWLTTVDAQTAQDRLQRSGVAAYQVLSIADSFVDPQLSHRGSYISLEHPLVGEEPMPGLPWNFARARCTVTRRAPLLGEHSFEVLQEVLGVTRSGFGELVESGAIETGPRGVGTDTVRTPS